MRTWSGLSFVRMTMMSVDDDVCLFFVGWCVLRFFGFITGSGVACFTSLAHNLIFRGDDQFQLVMLLMLLLFLLALMSRDQLICISELNSSGSTVRSCYWSIVFPIVLVVRVLVSLPFRGACFSVDPLPHQ